MRCVVLLVTFSFLATAAQSAEDASCGGCVDAAAVSVDATYTGEFWRAATGGLGIGNRYLDNLDLSVAVDGNEIAGLDGWRFFGSMLNNNGRPLANELPGALQGVSNIETDPATRLYELWMQWRTASGRASLRFGLYDLNSEFDSIETGQLFINPSHGIGPDFSQSGENGPSIFPMASLALRWQLIEGPWTVQAAVLDAKPGDPDQPDRGGIALSSREGALLVGEVDLQPESGVRTAAGYWRYTAGFDDIAAGDDAGNPRSRRDNAGAYAILESPMLLRRGEGRGLKLFARTGVAQSHINDLSGYYGAGAVYSGLIDSAWQNQFGFAVAVAELGTPAWQRLGESGVVAARHEYAYEFTCRFDISEHIVVQADVQYFDNPGMDATLKSSLVFGLRVEVAQHWQR